MNIRALLLGATVALVVTAAFATVTFDPNTGTGFVGKGDVQTVEGWNNATMQTNAPFITFKYDASTVYTVGWTNCPGNNTFSDPSDPSTSQCYPGHGEGTIKTGSITTTQGINATIVGTQRTNPQNQLTGFMLNGYTSPPVSTSGNVPTVGEACNATDPAIWLAIQANGDGLNPNNGDFDNCQITTVTVLSSGGGLYVGVNGTNWLLLQAF